MKKLNDRGNVAIISCLLITALLGFTAYVLDVGMVYIEKTKLTNAIDSGALAAALELPDNDMEARTAAVDYLQKNNVDPGLAVITVGVDYKSIQIEEIKNVKHLFAQVIGISSSNIKAKTKAVVAPAKSVTGGIRPFAVEVYKFSYGDLVTLKENAGDGYSGNYGAKLSK